jgi:serine protease inhibitor
VFLSTLRFPDSNLSIDDFAAGVRDIASHLKSCQTFIVRDVHDIWINADFNIAENTFNTSRRLLSVGVSTVKFPRPAVDVINRHIADATDGMIPAAVDLGSVNPERPFLITNALYLHDRWFTEFDRAATRSEPFSRFDGSIITTQIMRAKLSVPLADNDLAQIVYLPYTDSSCEFVAILPTQKTEAGFRRTMLAFDPSWFDSREATVVHLRLPKFRVMGTTRSLNELVGDLGLKEVFESRECIFPHRDGE